MVGLSCAGVGAAVVTVARSDAVADAPAIEEPAETAPLTIEDRYQELDEMRLQCATGAGGACNELGLAHETREDLWGHPVKGDGVKRDDGKAALYFRLACDHGRGEGCRNIARLYESGKGVEKNAAEAARYAERACALGDRAACGADGARPAEGAGLALRP